jgi:hypothetical protein
MAQANTFDDVSRREDLLDLITNLSPRETQLLSGLGNSTAKDVLHQWLVDTLKSVAVNSYVEGVDATFPDRTDPSRYYNVTQIVRVGYEVTDTERAVQNAGFNDRYAYEAQKALKEWSNDAEYALMRSSLACGTSSGARSMKGVKNFMASNNYTQSSSISLTEVLLNNYLQDVWDDGTQVNAIYVPMYLKRKISAFTAGTTKNTDQTDKRLVNAIDVYEADAAQMVKLFAHRYVTVSGDTSAFNYDMVGLDESKWRVAYLRKPFTRELSKTGDATKGEVVGELTLECLHKDAGFWAQGHL